MAFLLPAWIASPPPYVGIVHVRVFLPTWLGMEVAGQQYNRLAGHNMSIDLSCVQLATMRWMHQDKTHLLLHRRLLPGPGQAFKPDVVSFKILTCFNMFGLCLSCHLIWMVFLISGPHSSALPGAKARRAGSDGRACSFRNIWTLIKQSALNCCSCLPASATTATAQPSSNALTPASTTGRLSTTTAPTSDCLAPTASCPSTAAN